MADALFDRALELVMDAGQTLLENGGEVFRAQQTMEIMTASLGVRDFHVYVLTNGIFASAHLPGRDAVSLVRHVPTVSVHLGRVEAVNELSRELAAGRLGVVEAEGQRRAEQGAQALQNAGYATDPNYARKLTSMIQQLKSMSEKVSKTYSTNLDNLF